MHSPAGREGGDPGASEGSSGARRGRVVSKGTGQAWGLHSHEVLVADLAQLHEVGLEAVHALVDLAVVRGLGPQVLLQLCATFVDLRDAGLEPLRVQQDPGSGPGKGQWRQVALGLSRTFCAPATLRASKPAHSIPPPLGELLLILQSLFSRPHPPAAATPWQRASPLHLLLVALPPEALQVLLAALLLRLALLLEDLDGLVEGLDCCALHLQLLERGKAEYL